MSAQLAVVADLAAEVEVEDNLGAWGQRILDEFDAALRAARADYPLCDIPAKSHGIRSTTARARSRAHAAACARVVARLHRAGVR